MTFVERVLTRIFPTERLPFGQRWRIAGSYLSPDTDTSRSFLQRGLPWFRQCGVYIHRIDREDTDRHFHNHPANAGSLMLAGGYCESVLTDDGAKNNWVRPLEWNPVPTERYHRVQYLPNKRAWTLWFTGKPRWMIHPDTRKPVHYWTFKVDGKPMDWVTYRKEYGRG